MTIINEFEKVNENAAKKLVVLKKNAQKLSEELGVMLNDKKIKSMFNDGELRRVYHVKQLIQYCLMGISESENDEAKSVIDFFAFYFVALRHLLKGPESFTNLVEVMTLTLEV